MISPGDPEFSFALRQHLDAVHYLPAGLSYLAPLVAWVAPPFRSYGIGGPDNVIGGCVGVLELDGCTQEGGW